MNYENTNYLILNVSEVPLIDFSQVMQTSEATLRKSIDGTKTVIKWEGAEPSFVQSLTTKEGPYSHSEILEIMAGTEWSPPPMETP